MGLVPVGRTANLELDRESGHPLPGMVLPPGQLVLVVGRNVAMFDVPLCCKKYRWDLLHLDHNTSSGVLLTHDYD